jgi:hypothetical protein
MDLTEIGCEREYWVHLARDSVQWPGFYDGGNECSSSINAEIS